MKCVQLLWSFAFILLCQLSENRGLVDSKVRNRVQKWQQRTWRSRFGSGLRRDWKTAFEPPKSSHRARYGLSPREEDFFTTDGVPNAYSNYHYRRVGNSRGSSKGQRASKLSSGRWKNPDDGKYARGNRLKRHVRGHTEPSEEVKDYLDPRDLMLLGDDPNSEFIPLQPELGQQYNTEDTEENSRELPYSVSSDPTPGGDKKLKEFKIVFHHRNLNGSGVQSRISLGLLAFLIVSTLGITCLLTDEH
uniref:Uncharacterized protein n=1 Tax=Anopheles culicifacies TaxID=139723 RepID=A0A182MB81_9DIPT